MAAKKPVATPESPVEALEEASLVEEAPVEEATRTEAAAESVELKEDSDLEVVISTSDEVPLAVQVALSVIPASEAHPELPL